MNKRIIIIGIIVLLLFSVIPPILVNLLTFWRLPAGWVNQNNQWVGFFSSYLGGILGGVISGALTLGGVYLTIQEQRRKDYIDAYPEKRINGDELYFLLEKIDNFEKHFKEDRMGIVTGDCVSIIKQSKELLLRASKISGNSYQFMRDIIDSAENLIKVKDEMLKQGLPITDHTMAHMEEMKSAIFEIKRRFYFLKAEYTLLLKDYERFFNRERKSMSLKR